MAFGILPARIHSPCERFRRAHGLLSRVRCIALFTLLVVVPPLLLSQLEVILLLLLHSCAIKQTTDPCVGPAFTIHPHAWLTVVCGWVHRATDYWTHQGYGYGGTRAGLDWHRGNETSYFGDDGNYSANCIVGEALDFLKRRTADPTIPFFLSVAQSHGSHIHTCVDHGTHAQACPLGPASPHACRMFTCRQTHGPPPAQVPTVSPHTRPEPSATSVPCALPRARRKRHGELSGHVRSLRVQGNRRATYWSTGRNVGRQV